MARRNTSLFNLSFLDLLSGALGAVIFLFVITPKGGSPAAHTVQTALYVDTLNGKFYGDFPDSLSYKDIGDTLFTILVDYRKMPGMDQPPNTKPPVALWAPPAEKPKPKPESPQPKKQEPEKSVSESQKTKSDPQPVQPKTKTAPPEKAKEPAPPPPVYKGDAPSVPCLVSFELSWPSKQSNVDLYICKGNDCVFGGRKRDRNIGEWDSGKSRNRLFGNDLRTNQEAVRQFDRIVPGEYKIYAVFKEGKKNQQSVPVRGLIYTQSPSGQERGTSFQRTLPLGKERTLLGTVILYDTGKFRFAKP